VLIALLAIARKFILLDLQATAPMEILALAAAVLSLGIVYWLIREQDARVIARKFPSDTGHGEQTRA